MLHWIHKARHLGDAIRYRMTTAAFLFGGALLMATAIGFAIAGGYLWLQVRLPSYQAAFIVAGMLCLLSMAVIIPASRRGAAAKPPARVSRAPDPDTEAERASEQIVQSAITVAMDTPIKAVIAATAIGFIVGLLRSKK